MHLTLGVDAGGTTSRALLTSTSGTPLSRATAGPGNPATQGTQAAVHIGRAIREALNGHNPADVTAAVIGLAGISGLATPEIAEAFTTEWKTIGLTCEIAIVGDAVTAFAAATEATTGTVLIAGTGAVAAQITNYEITRTADGLGWLLGDKGSAHWLGLQAVKAAARNFTTPLAQTIAAHAKTPTVDALIAWANRLPPASFAALAPTVCTSQDPIAAELTTRAAAHLLTTLDELAAPGPVVLAGALLTESTPVQTAVLHNLHNRGIFPTLATDPATGAVRVATTGLGAVGAH